MPGYIDLHCHWLSGIDDGAPSVGEGLEMLTGLKSLGFSRVMATPHMRPGMFDNTQQHIQAAFAEQAPQARATGMQVELACEHYFDDVVFERIRTGEGLPYPGERAVLLEFYEIDFPQTVIQLLARLSRNKLTPVIAHPERYQAIWKQPSVLEQLLDAGAVALLDVAALVGKYGSRPKRCARQLLKAGLYHAACSDAHRAKDLAAVESAMTWVRSEYGQSELNALFEQGPVEILEGTATR